MDYGDHGQKVIPVTCRQVSGHASDLLLSRSRIDVIVTVSLKPVRGQTSNKTRGSMASQDSFESSLVEVSGNTIFMRRYGKGPAILLVHGFPRTSLMWRFLAPKLAENHTVICVDLRAYGRSGIPASSDDHFPYSKRAMAKELVEVMGKLGFPTFISIDRSRPRRTRQLPYGLGSSKECGASGRV